MQDQHVAGLIRRHQRLEDLGLVVDDRHHAIPGRGEGSQPVGLGRREVLAPAAGVHLEQLVVEVHPVLTTEGVERAQCRGPQRLGPSRGQADERGRLELEPADDVHDTGRGGAPPDRCLDVEHHEQPFAGRAPRQRAWCSARRRIQPLIADSAIRGEGTHAR